MSMRNDSGSRALESGVQESPTVLRRHIQNQLYKLRNTVKQLPDQPGAEDVTFFWQLMTCSKAKERQIVGAMAALTVISVPAAGAALKWFPDKENPGERLQTYAEIAYMIWRERHLE